MIPDFILGMLTEFLGFLGGVLPRISLGPLGPNGAVWGQITELGTRMGWLAPLLPWTAIGVAATFIGASAVTSFALWTLRFCLKILRILQ